MKGWPKFTAACNMGDWIAAAAECKMEEAGNPGLVPRNLANRQLFEYAVSHEDLQEWPLI